VARIVPSDIARLELAGANRHEIETLRLLQARLPDSYYAPFPLLMELARLELTRKSGPGGPVRTLPLDGR
jgi:hypothetical protein